MKQKCVFSMEELPCLADHQLEGTPFVPMAVIVDELARTFGRDCCSFADIEIKMPVMLRRNRARTLTSASDGDSASLLDETGNLHASIKKGADIVADSGFTLTAAREKIPAAVLKHQIYPALMFHGPTFQADFVFYEFNRQTILVELSDFGRDPAKLGRCTQDQRIPIVLFDLLLQTAGLHLLAFSDNYGLPSACASLTVFNRRPSGNVLVRTTCHNGDVYSIIAGDLAGNPIMTCSGLRFAKSSRHIEADRKKLLEKLTK
ncbi:MAG: hypothetical protein CVV42_13765 [Candidatus Riflebacteria bacterium HGW-Riflebacteria-2]|jgi:hypothetical protein|nr:MAG: hypothetical protein CVV42_13765 [Candidatus Riflebacteria bacterium HGW-Riflebacteria-2]